MEKIHGCAFKPCKYNKRAFCSESPYGIERLVLISGAVEFNDGVEVPECIFEKCSIFMNYKELSKPLVIGGKEYNYFIAASDDGAEVVEEEIDNENNPDSGGYYVDDEGEEHADLYERYDEDGPAC